ncbi:hypothetical protein AAC387_Pa12g1143 [Persea americana]
MKPCYLHYAILFMLIFSSGIAVEIVVEGSGRCSIVMDHHGCNLSLCKQHCLEKKNGNGVCLATVQESYLCVCYYNCQAT